MGRYSSLTHAQTLGSIKHVSVNRSRLCVCVLQRETETERDCDSYCSLCYSARILFFRLKKHCGAMKEQVLQ